MKSNGKTGGKEKLLRLLFCITGVKDLMDIGVQTNAISIKIASEILKQTWLQHFSLFMCFQSKASHSFNVVLVVPKLKTAVQQSLESGVSVLHGQGSVLKMQDFFKFALVNVTMCDVKM